MISNFSFALIIAFHDKKDIATIAKNEKIVMSLTDEYAINPNIKDITTDGLRVFLGFLFIIRSVASKVMIKNIDIFIIRKTGFVWFKFSRNDID